MWILTVDNPELGLGLTHAKLVGKHSDVDALMNTAVLQIYTWSAHTETKWCRVSSHVRRGHRVVSHVTRVTEPQVTLPKSQSIESSHVTRGHGASSHATQVTEPQVTLPKSRSLKLTVSKMKSLAFWMNSSFNDCKKKSPATAQNTQESRFCCDFVDVCENVCERECVYVRESMCVSESESV